MHFSPLIKCAIALLAAAPCYALATLGEKLDPAALPSTTAVAPNTAPKVIRKSATSKYFSVIQSEQPSGTLVDQYVAPNGVVFAVTWQGPVKPDLRELLGRSFDTYIEAAQQPHAGRHNLSIQRAGLVMHSNGRMRAFSGLAYLPDLLPANVSVDDLK